MIDKKTFKLTIIIPWFSMIIPIEEILKKINEFIFRMNFFKI